PEHRIPPERRPGLRPARYVLRQVPRPFLGGIRGSPPPLPRRPRRLVERAGRAAEMAEALGRRARLVRPALREMVRRRENQRLGELPRPPCRRRERGPRR